MIDVLVATHPDQAIYSRLFEGIDRGLRGGEIVAVQLRKGSDLRLGLAGIRRLGAVICDDWGEVFGLFANGNPAVPVLQCALDRVGGFTPDINPWPRRLFNLPSGIGVARTDAVLVAQIGRGTDMPMFNQVNPDPGVSLESDFTVDNQGNFDVVLIGGVADGIAPAEADITKIAAPGFVRSPVTFVFRITTPAGLEASDFSGAFADNMVRTVQVNAALHFQLGGLEADGDTFFVDEVFVKIGGKQHYLWRAVDQDGEVVDVYLQARRDGAAVTTRLQSAFSSGCCLVMVVNPGRY